MLIIINTHYYYYVDFITDDQRPMSNMHKEGKSLYVFDDELIVCYKYNASIYSCLQFVEQSLGQCNSQVL